MIRRRYPRRTFVARRNAGRQAEWTNIAGNNILVAGTVQRFDLLTQYATDAGINASAMKNFRLERIIGRVSMQKTDATGAFASSACGILVADIASPSTSMSPLTSQATSWNWMYLDWWHQNAITGDTNTQNNVNLDNARYVDIRTRRVLRSNDSHLFVCFDSSAGSVRFAFNFRILVSRP